MSDMAAVKVGDKIVVVVTYRQCDPKVEDFIVSRVGRKYFYAQRCESKWNSEIRFNLEDGGSGGNHHAYRTLKEYEDSVRIYTKHKNLRLMLTDYRNRLERLSEADLDTLISLMEKARG